MQRQNLSLIIRLSRVICSALLVIMLGGLLESDAAAQAISFGTNTDFSTGSFPRSIAVSDFNGDGNLDLAVVNSDINSANTVSILLGTGVGTFGPKSDFATGSAPFSVAVGDFNRDGNIDLAIANSNGDAVSILLGTGTGSFGTKADFNTGSRPISVAVGDFNEDGALDLAVANQFSASVSILLGTGAGAFGTKTDFSTGSGSASVAVSDFNGDGKLDLAIANFSVGSVSILLGTGTGTFGTNSDFAASGTPRSVAAGDFNVDGKVDLAVANGGTNTVSILLGTGTGTFGPKTDFGTGTNNFSLTVGDFNVDGKLDLAMANGGSDSVSILAGTGTGMFGTKIDFGTGSAPQSVAVADFNGDGRLDVATANAAASGGASVLLNTTKVTSCVEPLATLFTVAGGSSRLKISASVGCNWTATSNDSWITIASPTGGTGTGTINYSVAPNPTANPRNGSLVIAGRRYLIAQEAQACAFSISPGGASFGTSSGTGAVNVTTLMGCNWTAVSNAPWITITSGASGNASGLVNYSVDANLGSNPRTGTMTVAGQTFTVNQSGIGIVVVAPNGGETWPKGTTQVIRWTFAPAAGAQVRIELLKGGVLNSNIVAKTAIGTGGIGSFNWVIPTTAPKGSDFQVRITSVTDATFTDTSDGMFTLGNAIALLDRVETPNQRVMPAVSLTQDMWRDAQFSQVSIWGGALLNDPSPTRRSSPARKPTNSSWRVTSIGSGKT